MARKSKPGEAAAFSVAQWATLTEGFARAKAALGGAELAERDLAAHLRLGLPSAARRIARDGTETFERLKPSFWDGLTLLEVWDADLKKRSGKIRVRGGVIEGRAWYFVGRARLDQLYPPVGGAPPAPPDDDAAPSAERRKPGRKPAANWPIHVAGELHRIVITEGKPPPPASYFAEFCGEKLDYQPDLRAVQRLLKTLLST